MVTEDSVVDLKRQLAEAREEAAMWHRMGLEAARESAAFQAALERLVGAVKGLVELSEPLGPDEAIRRITQALSDYEAAQGAEEAISVFDPTEPRPTRATGEWSDVWSRPQCPHCRCTTFAKVDEPTLDGGWDNTKTIRCVHCKRTFAAPPDAKEHSSISTDGPNAIDGQRLWLARQLLDSRLTEAEAFGIVAFHPQIKDLWSDYVDAPKPPLTAEPVDWVLVPRVATDEILRAILHASGATPAEIVDDLLNAEDSATRKVAMEIYAAALASAPPPPLAAAESKNEKIERLEREIGERHRTLVRLVLGDPMQSVGGSIEGGLFPPPPSPKEQDR